MDSLLSINTLCKFFPLPTGKGGRGDGFKPYPFPRFPTL